MQTSNDLLNAVSEALKARGDSGSDYAVSKALGLSRQAISKIRSGLNGLGNDAGIKAAEVIGMDPLRILAILGAERSKTEVERSTWELLLKRLGGMAAAFVFAAVLLGGTLSPDIAHAYQFSGNPESICIM